jgi:hypothetical protein
MAYFTNIGPKSGPLRDGSLGAIGVLLARDNHMPIGVAMGAGKDAAGVVLRKLTVQKVELPGRLPLMQPIGDAPGSKDDGGVDLMDFLVR